MRCSQPPSAFAWEIAWALRSHGPRFEHNSATCKVSGLEQGTWFTEDLVFTYEDLLYNYMEYQACNKASNIYGIALFFAINVPMLIARPNADGGCGWTAGCLSQPEPLGQGTAQTVHQRGSSLLPVTCSLTGLSILVSALESVTS